MLALLGIGLFALWVISAGLGVRPWLMWTDGGLAIVSLVCAIALPNRASPRLRVEVIGALSWLLWTTLGFAVMYLWLAAGSRIEQHRAA